MASTISAGTTSGTAIAIAGDTTGNLAFQTSAGTYTQTMPNATGTVMVSGNMPAFSAYYSGGAQTPSANTYTKLIFNTKDFDTANCFDSITNYRFTPNVAGYYQINLICTVGQNGSSQTTYYSAIYKNGSIYANTATGQVPAGAYGNQSMSIVVYLNGSTDYIEAYINPAANQGYYPNNNNRTVALSGVLMRAA
jgi:hypothetical protein